MTRYGIALLLMLPAMSFTRAAPASGELAPLMETARMEGWASGALGGEVAARMRGVGVTAPVEVTVRRLYRLEDPGCARLRVSFDQHGVILPGETEPRDRHAEFAMNWCDGGRPPASGAGTRPAKGEDRR